eukprot:COSAG01_NODE_4532_length_4948_cov_3.063724_3_plen_167_part_00
MVDSRVGGVRVRVTIRNLEPRHYESVLNRGIALAKLGHADEAIESWQRAISVFPGDSRAPFNIGLGYTKLDPPQHEEAIHYFRLAIEAPSRVASNVPGTAGGQGAEQRQGQGRSYSRLAMSLEALQRYQEASEAYMAAYERDPKGFPQGEQLSTKMTWKATQKQEV